MSGAARDLLTEMIRIPSFTAVHPDAPSNAEEMAGKVLDIVAAEAAVSKAVNIRRMKFNTIDNLLVQWESSAVLPGHTRKLLVIAHIDVVPVDQDQWSVDPFGAVIKDGYLYGRGAVDMKGPLAAFMISMRNLAARYAGYDVDLIVTADEEWDAVDGTKRVMEAMKAEGMRKPDAVLVIEPSADVKFGNKAAIGRRGSLNGRIHIGGKEGHAAGTTFVNQTKTLAKVLRGLQRIVFKDNPGFFDKVLRFVRREKGGNSQTWLAKTNLEVTYYQSDGKRNSSTVPAGVTVYWNIRYTGTYTAEQLDAMVKAAVMRYSTNDNPITVVSNLSSASNPYHGYPGALLEVIRQVVREQLGLDIDVTQGGGTSDGRFVETVWGKIEVIEFGPLIATMHQNDECIELAELYRMVPAYEAVVERICNPDGVKQAA
ncbi:MAG: hypothetical protein DI585_05090 [Pseudomonas fluorescens]|nr:MAG: hypothetical protein DI585_05090 [Pseudomonas fluorescens]